jgi:CBS domain containing-hemolysin-like protein
MTALILVAVGIVLISFLCSIMEAALYSIPPSRVESLLRQGNRGAKRLAKLRSDIDKPISAILILNTLANSAGAVVAGAIAAQVLGSHLIGLFTAVLTLIILMLGEIAPKTLGAVHASVIAPRIAFLIEFLVFILWPLLLLTRGLTRLLRTGEPAHAASEEDILAMAHLGVSKGALLPEELRWVTNALKLNDITARDIMTPRTVVYSLPTDLPLDLVEAHSAHWTHSRLPLVKDDHPDQVEGMILRRDVFDALVAGKTEGTLRDMMKPVVYVPDSMPANRLLQTLIQSRQHLAIVVNEFGGMDGVVTLEDVLECLLGEEIVDEYDVHVDMQEYARRRAARRRAGLSSPSPGKAAP